MLPDWSTTWLAAGLLLGAVFTIGIGAAFVLGQQLFPDARSDGPRASGEARRRAEIRRYLDEIGERYVEHHLVAGQRVAFFLPERDVAITFDVETFFRIRRTGTVAVLYEHEMPVHHLGARFPFEVPTVETPSTPGPDGTVRAAFATLDLPVGVDADRVETAYRNRIKESHPDHGGDETEFRQVREAYAIAKDHVED